MLRNMYSLPMGGSFLPINIQGSGLLGKGKGNKNTPVNRNEQCNIFGNEECNVFGSNRATFSEAMVQ